ncbi:MAG: hypothetical protein ACW99Q_26620, partial [Candidatus Kariarchaeaceae archaeon]
MTSLVKYGIFIGILFIIAGTSPIQGTNQNINSTSPILDRIWSQSYDDQSDSWWIFVDLQIDENYWQNLQTFSLVITLQGQSIDLIPDIEMNKDIFEFKRFVGLIIDISSGDYIVSIEWKDGSTSKVWTNEKLLIGTTSYIDKFHFITPIVILVATLVLGVIFPGKLKYITNNKSNNNK